MGETISWPDFAKLDMRTGTIIAVNDFPEARNAAYQLQVDFGVEIGTRSSSAQLTKRYTKTQLLGKQVIAIINFPKKQIANFMSECLILGAVDGSDIVLLQPENKTANGLKIA